MRVAILYICTGKYNQFFEGFYESAERFFLKGVADIEYFVFTDNMSLINSPKVHLYKRECKGFPMDSLFRFDMFLSVKEEIQVFDYCFFFNANMLIVEPIGLEFLPKKSSFEAVLSPGYYNKPAWRYPYERRKASTAYIGPYQKPYRYYMGSLNGGTSEAFIKFAETCSYRTHLDYDNGIIAKFHDESHLNKYMREVNGDALSPSYAFPEGSKIPCKPIIVIRDKVKIDSYFNKNRKFDLFSRFSKVCLIIKEAIGWYLKL